MDALPASLPRVLQFVERNAGPACAAQGRAEPVLLLERKSAALGRGVGQGQGEKAPQRWLDCGGAALVKKSRGAPREPSSQRNTSKSPAWMSRAQAHMPRAGKTIQMPFTGTMKPATRPAGVLA